MPLKDILQKIQTKTMEIIESEKLEHHISMSATYPERCYDALDEKSTSVFDLLERVEATFLNQPNYGVLLLTGASGAGKSWFGRCWVRSLWDRHSLNNSSNKSVTTVAQSFLSFLYRNTL